MVARLLLLILLIPYNLEAQKVTVMFYNVQNLFDYRHDEGKNDWQFLPHNYPGKTAGCRRDNRGYFRQLCLDTDWNKQKFKLKIAQIAELVKHNGLPDILGVCEVENRYALANLAEQLGYDKYVMTDSPARRGIDVALLYRQGPFVYQRHRQYRLTNSRRPTRNLLEVEFSFPKLQERLLVYVLHWPAQGAPSSERMFAATHLMQTIKEQNRQDKQTNILVIGDFNVIAEDHPHPFHELFDGQLFDARQAFVADRSISRQQKRSLALGTYFYAPTMDWVNLDRIFFNTNLRDNRGLEVDHKSFRIVSPPQVTKDFIYDRPEEYLYGSMVKNVPKKYNFNAISSETAGYSDHFAVRIDLVARCRAGGGRCM